MSIDAFKSKAFGTESTSPMPGFGGQSKPAAPSPKGHQSSRKDARPSDVNTHSTTKQADKPKATKKPAAKPRRRTRAPQRTTLKIANEVIEVVRDVEGA